MSMKPRETQMALAAAARILAYASAGYNDDVVRKAWVKPEEATISPPTRAQLMAGSANPRPRLHKCEV